MLIVKKLCYDLHLDSKSMKDENWSEGARETDVAFPQMMMSQMSLLL